MPEMGSPAFGNRSPDEPFSALHALRLWELRPEILQRFIRALPKIDLHCHIEGAIDPELYFEVGTRHGISLPAATLDALRPLLQITPQDKSLIDFLKKFPPIGQIFSGTQAIEEIAYSIAVKASRDKVIYWEPRFSPLYMAQAYHLDPAEVVQSVVNGTRAAERDHGIRSNLILIAERQMGVQAAWQVFRLFEKFKSQGVVALDLANDELNFPPDPYAEVFQAVKQAGGAATAHAAEVPRPENVRCVIEKLQVDRIGHGVLACLDAAVVSLIRERQVPLEICLTSNLQTGAWPDIRTHPVWQYQRSGIAVTLNTDDPAVSRIDLSEELCSATREGLLTAGDLCAIMVNSARFAFLPGSQRIALEERIVTNFYSLLSEALGWQPA